MDLPNLKELEKLLKLCRKQGVTDVVLGNLSFKFGDLPQEKVDAPDVDGLPVMPSDEDMAFWSAQPDPLAQRAEQ